MVAVPGPTALSLHVAHLAVPLISRGPIAVTPEVVGPVLASAPSLPLIAIVIAGTGRRLTPPRAVVPLEVARWKLRGRGSGIGWHGVGRPRGVEDGDHGGGGTSGRHGQVGRREEGEGSRRGEGRRLVGREWEGGRQVHGGLLGFELAEQLLDPWHVEGAVGQDQGLQAVRHGQEARLGYGVKGGYGVDHRGDERQLGWVDLPPPYGDEGQQGGIGQECLLHVGKGLLAALAGCGGGGGGRDGQDGRGGEGERVGVGAAAFEEGDLMIAHTMGVGRSSDSLCLGRRLGVMVMRVG